MAINKNHEFEELDGVKCAIVEKNVSKERVEFLKQLLEFNKYTVVVVAAPPPKAAPAKAAAPAAKPAATADTAAATATAATNGTMPAAVETPAVEPPPPPPAPSLFTVGVSDVTFNPINAVFGRLLKTPDGHIVTLAYWQQKEGISRDDIPYYVKK